MSSDMSCPMAPHPQPPVSRQEVLMKVLSRRTFLGAAAGAALAAPSVARAQARELVMVGYGTVQDEPIKRVGTELARRNPGVSLRVIGGLSAEAIAQVKGEIGRAVCRGRG